MLEAEEGGRGLHWNAGLRRSLSEKVASELRPVGAEEMSRTDGGRAFWPAASPATATVRGGSRLAAASVREAKGGPHQAVSASTLNEKGPRQVLSRGQRSLRLLKICLISASRARISGASARPELGFWE